MRRSASCRRIGRLTIPLLVTALALLLAACGEQASTDEAGLPGTSDEAVPFLLQPGEVVTSQGSQAAGLYLPVFLVAVVIFILVEGLLLLAILRFRRKPTDTELPEQVHGHHRLEIVWTAIPALIVTLMFVGSMVVLTNVEARSDEPAVTVDVTAYTFGWTFDYQDRGITVSGADPADPPEMVLPVGQPVRFRLHAVPQAPDGPPPVIHSFYVPAFFFKRDVIPGRVNEFEVTIEKPGTYGGQCAEFCGLGHGTMYFSVRAVSPDEFDAWVAERGGPSESLSPPAASPAAGVVLEIASTAEKPIAYATSSLEATAGQTVTVRYHNDTNRPHNVAFFDGPDATGTKFAWTEVVVGPGVTAETTFTAPETPGSYLFRCDIHPLQMTGVLTVLP